MAYPLAIANPGFICSYHSLHIQEVLMQESVSLVHEAILGVKDFRISCVHYILDDVGILVHFCFCFFHSFLCLLISLPFLTILSHHVLLPYLIEAFTHFDKQLFFESLEFLELYELDVLQRACGRLPLFRIQYFWQKRIRRELFLHSAKFFTIFVIFFGLSFITFRR